MPLYFFDLHNDMDVLDHDGKDFPDLNAAKENALAEAREMMKQAVDDGELNLGHDISVRDENGTTVYVLRFGEAVRVIPQKLPS